MQGQRWQGKYQNQGTCEAHCDCKRKERIFKIDLFCSFFSPLKELLSIFVVLYKVAQLVQDSWSHLPALHLFLLVFNDLAWRLALVGRRNGKGWCSGWANPFGQSGLVWFPRSPTSLCRSPASCCCRWQLCLLSTSWALGTAPALVGGKTGTMNAYHHDNDYEYKGLAEWSDISMRSTSITC